MKTLLHSSLRTGRAALLWKLDGLGERDLRLPRTPTGLNLLGIVKHMAHVEAGYFGDTFGRPWPHSGELVPLERFATEPQADWYATAEESAVGVLDLYRRVQAFADETIAELPLDAPGTVRHWSAPRNAVTLGQIMLHVLVDLTRHLGQADILRESIDGQVGLTPASPNIPEGEDWGAYVARLTALAEGA